jgi:hypothetical protein
MSRPALYRALSGEGSPGFATITKVMRAPGLKPREAPHQSRLPDVGRDPYETCARFLNIDTAEGASNCSHARLLVVRTGPRARRTASPASGGRQ